MDAREDASLLLEVAQKRDQAAFTELFRRYEQHVFNLALRLLHNSAWAEDAVQETMLAVWQAAGSFRPDGCARTWILGIAARQSLKIARTRKRAQAREDSLAGETAMPADAASSKLEKEELLGFLRRNLEKLPELDRQVLVCCFGANLTHREIGEALGMPHQTVSKKLQKLLERLQLDLRAAGFAAAAPLVLSDRLNEAILTGHRCPPGLYAGACEKMAGRLKDAAHSMSRRAATVSRGSALLVPSVAAILAAGAGLWYWAVKPAQPKAPAAVRAQAPAPVPAIPAWQPFGETTHTDLGGKGKWTAEKTATGLTLAFAPPGGVPQRQPAYCYLGRNFTSSREIRGTLACNGGEEWSYVELGLCYPNRLNCVSYALCFKKDESPLAFRIQYRFSDKGCACVLSVRNSKGQLRATAPEADEWVARPWHVSSKKPPGQFMWSQLALAQMRECGLAFVSVGAIKIADLQIRPLADSEWCADLGPGPK